VTPFRYPQECPIARAAEIIGERWTLLILRELALGPRRFSDLRAGLSEVSSSVLADRIAHLQDKGLVTREQLPPPAASAVYRLTESGRALEPVLFGLLRWGARFLGRPRPGDRFEPEWMRLVLQAYARRGPSPPHSFAIRIATGARDVALRVAGGSEGTTVTEGEGSADVAISAGPAELMGLMSGMLRPSDALAAGKLRAEGRMDLLDTLPELFDMRPDST